MCNTDHDKHQLPEQCVDGNWQSPYPPITTAQENVANNANEPDETELIQQSVGCG